MSVRTPPTGKPFTIGGIACMKCRQCGVTRELQQFWRQSTGSKPEPASQMVCTHCR